MIEPKVALEAAELEFENFLECMDVDSDPLGMDDDDRTNFNKGKNRIIKAIQRGDLVFNDAGEAVYTPCREGSKHKDPITFHERTGASLIATDGKKNNQQASKTYAVMGDLCRLPAKTFSGLVGPDIKTCEAIFGFLMD